MEVPGSNTQSIEATPWFDEGVRKSGVGNFQQILVNKAIEWFVGGFAFHRQLRPGLFLNRTSNGAAQVAAEVEKRGLGPLTVNGDVINRQAQLLWEQATKKSTFGKPFASKMELDIWGSDVVLLDTLEVPENYEQLWYLYNYVLYPRFLTGKPTVVTARHSFNEFISLTHSKLQGVSTSHSEIDADKLAWLMKASLVDCDDFAYQSSLELPPMLKPEVALYKALKEQGLEPKPQHVVGDLMLDFAVIEGKNKLAIQCNGAATVDAFKRRSQEMQINNILFSQGWQILKFSSSEISHNLSQCVDAIEELFAGGTKKNAAGRWVVAQKHDAAEELPVDDDMQAQATASGGGPAIVTGGAGTGKTKCLLRRAAHLISQGVSPEKILILAQSTESLEVLKQKFETELGRQTSQRLSCFVFDDLGLRIIKEHLPLLQRKGPVKIDTAPYRTIARVLTKYRKDLDPLASQQTATIDEFVLVKRFALYKRQLISAQQVKAQAKTEVESLIASVFQGYEDELRKANRIDAEDRVALAAQLLLGQPRLKEQYQAQYEFVLVDEYQDITPAQDILLRVFAGPSDNFMLAGEVDEALEQSEGGCPDLLISISLRIPQTRCFRLEKNWRLDSSTIRSALRVTARLADWNDYKLGTSTKIGTTASIIQVPVKLSDENAEAEWVVQQCRKLIAGGRDAGQIAVLYQEPRYGSLLEEAIAAAGIRCKSPSTGSDLVPDEAQDMLSFLKLVVDPDGPRTKDAFEKICQLCMKEADPKLSGIIAAFAAQNNLSYLKAVEIYSEATADKSCRELEQLVRMIRRLHQDKLPPAEVISLITRAYRLNQYYQSVRVPQGTNYEPLRKLKRLEESAYKFNSLEEFVRYQESLKDGTNSDGNAQPLSILTISGGKGQEFPVVFVTGMIDGILPARAAENMDEQRKLVYVALTRASEKLFLSYPEKINGAPVTPSPFLIDAGLIQADPYAKLQKTPAPAATTKPATAPVATAAAAALATPVVPIATPVQPAASNLVLPAAAIPTPTPSKPAQDNIAPIPHVQYKSRAENIVQTQCANCKMPLEPEARFCGECGSATAPAPTQPTQPIQPKATMPACRTCGTLPEEGARFCGQCGTPATAAPAA
jgi:superfamily I DNA/RNA helicase/very-short-patch-repair endonuclease